MPARYEVIIAPAAERDLEEIWDYIAADNPENAAAFIVTLEKQLATLEHFPARAPLIPENEQLGTSYRHLLHGAYRTIFRISGKRVFILRIIHGARLVDASGFGAE